MCGGSGLAQQLWGTHLQYSWSQLFTCDPHLTPLITVPAMQPASITAGFPWLLTATRLSSGAVCLLPQHRAGAMTGHHPWHDQGTWRRRDLPWLHSPGHDPRCLNPNWGDFSKLSFLRLRNVSGFTNYHSENDITRSMCSCALSTSEKRWFRAFCGSQYNS